MTSRHGGVDSVVERLLSETEARVGLTAADHARMIIAELFPDSDAVLLYEVFYLPCVRPRVQDEFSLAVSEQLDTYTPSPSLLEEAYLKANRSACEKFFTVLLDPLIVVRTSNFGAALEAAMDIFDAQGWSYEEACQSWADQLPDYDYQLWWLALHDMDAYTIKEEMQLPSSPEEITYAVFKLQRDLIMHLVNVLRARYRLDARS